VLIRDPRGGCGDRLVRARVECIQVLRGPSVEVAQGEGCAAHQPDARDLASGAKLGAEVSETGDDLITVERSA